ncbi:SET domain-containing protein [Trichoderma citrinoviride]|uniref:SET domain-containing protein n=1 Tax=Trichoderma citrinoviride TaxID=58853 RepID=A0A2T4B120_9HYPO|nr:SET domain-containing protein [Trichoderma citrinoviride]PTB63014.1 SET domain-containing protein [Trichoderma citrinoviride]
MASDDRIALLLSWASSNAATLHPSVQIYDDPTTGLSFRVHPFSPSPIPPYEPIVSLPTHLSLSYLNAIHPAPAFPKSFLARAPPHVVGRLLLVKELLRGPESFWYPYIQALPQPEDVDDWALPPLWPEEEAELLEGTNVEIGLDKIREDLGREFRDAQKLLLASNEDAEDDFSNLLTRELYQWAYCVFSSRSFRPSLVLSREQQQALPPGVSVNDFSVLLPLFDIGNHDMTVHVRWDVTAPGDASAGGGEASAVQLKVGREHKPGEQIFNNYSPKTNAELLLGYGFMLPITESLHNDYIHPGSTSPDEYLISLRPISHPSSLLAASKQTLAVFPPGLLGAFTHVQHDMVWDIFLTLLQHSSVPLIKLIPLDKNTFPSEEEAVRQRQEKFFSGRVNDECRDFLEQTVAIIQHKVLQELERLNETDMEVVGEDAALLSPNQRLALEYRERCRMVLENTLTAMGEDEFMQDDDDEGSDTV